MSRFVIDLYGIRKSRSIRFSGLFFNLLNYFHLHRDVNMFERIIIWCKDTSKEMFSQFGNMFDVKDFAYSSIFRRLCSAKYVEIINRIYVETHRGEDLKFRIEQIVLHSAYEERRMAV